MNRAITFDVGAGRTLTMQQVSHNGPVHVDITWGQHVEAQYSVPADDMKALLNWYRRTKGQGLPLFPSEQPPEPMHENKSE